MWKEPLEITSTGDYWMFSDGQTRHVLYVGTDLYLCDRTFNGRPYVYFSKNYERHYGTSNKITEIISNTGEVKWSIE